MINPPAEFAPALERIPGVVHGFFGRRRMQSAASGQDLNTSDTFSDPAELADFNRRLALSALGLGAARTARVKQVHSAKVVTLDAPLEPEHEADGMVTARHGLALLIITADCVPVLFADPVAGVIGACHAGWRGAVDAIVANTVSAMQALGATPDNIVAAIGPAISGANYEIGPEFAENLRTNYPQAAPFVFTPQTAEKEHFDLPAFVTSELQRSGVGSIERSANCTYANPAHYFSHRHYTHHGGTQGRQLSVICLSE